ncbi:hypothetical protein GUJ93_ZPchr0002g26645 [Zizania palustris]|uniref:RING-type domain-containing protein n=1 Tax=Zizania palustris TaxID=103762 RepID=A0A8J5VCF8_ZIZPA|nr:hypothetical protein GUJ93_ZPchr0002g26645 [Zizania palustris]
MLPGVECARRRRLRQAAEAPCGPRRPSFCLYVGGHDHAHLGSSGPKHRSGACEAAARVHGWPLDSNARQAKERLDQKLRSQRETVVNRHSSAGRSPQAATNAPQREVYSRKGSGGGGRRRWFFSLGRLGRRLAPEAEEECAVCLEELRAGDAVAQLPCTHRFHWSCAVPWVQAASHCPVCRAVVHLATDQQYTPSTS